MLNSRDRLLRRATSPRLVNLYRALTRLRSTVTVMNTGAHPDDEHNGMLATLRHQHGTRIVIACSTRGEGGQNILGPERLGALGVIRSRELEEAARALDADVAWLGHGPDDPVHDFGFSKSGPDTLGRWGEDRTIDRLVRAYRQFRPDIVIPTFLDVPGQHGHHRAMTEAAERAVALAADPAYVTEGYGPWKVSKFYLPAWSGGDAYYDDEVPPPPRTTEVVAIGTDPVTGMSYDRIGEVSRAYHGTQNMGVWKQARTSWELHLVGGSSETSVLDNLPENLAGLGNVPELAAADAAIEKAITAFPNADAIIATLIEAKRALAAANGSIAEQHAHRVVRKLAEMDAAIALAAGIDISASVSNAEIIPGGTVELSIEVEPGSATHLAATVHAAADLEAAQSLPLSAGVNTTSISATADAKVTNAFLPDWQSLGGNGLVHLEIEANVGGEIIRFAVDPEEALQIAPPHAVSISPDAIIVPLGQSKSQRIGVKGIDPSALTLPATSGVTAIATTAGLELDLTAALPSGRHSLPLQIDGNQAYSVTPIAYPHIGRTRFVQPQNLNILALDLILPQTRVGFVSGGADRIGLWLERMGADVTQLDAEALTGDLSQFDTIIVGIFAFGTRPDLAAATSRLHEWVRKGGHLVTLYHRPTDGWNPETTPPLPLTIGSPSLRWRVTNPASAVEILEDEHPLLAGPNRITLADFAGWDKERGLYFASRWNEAYVPLLAMHDSGEAPLTGSLISARIDKGRHTHTSLVLHHQMDKLVPGAFRLMANLLQRA